MITAKLEAFRMLTDYHYKLIKIEAENSKKEPGKPVSIVASWFLTSVKNKEGKRISIDEISSILETKINKNEPFIVFSQTGEVYSQLSASAKGSEDGSAIVRYGKAARPSTDIFYSVESDHIVLNLYNRNSESFETSPRGVKFNLNNNMLTLNYLYPMFSEIQLRRYE
ncbi:hypothetical protein [Pseudoalteromonas sp. B62]|uniref:hypothetical protein n=1 Tax=Pseudoalteromonas sp. B62 TaxID=630483 RepID=UPI00301CC616